jgi:hypothetical protein
MSDTRDRFRHREPAQTTTYDSLLAAMQQRVHRATHGRIVIRSRDVTLEQNRQGLQRYFLNSHDKPGDETADTAVQDWDVFDNNIVTHSGKHTHQGGLTIYVVRGEGYTIVDGERVDWKAGDLLLLPIRPGGVEHQHFSTTDEIAEWVAFIFRPMHNAIGSYVEQVSAHPDFGG